MPQKFYENLNFYNVDNYSFCDAKLTTMFANILNLWWQAEENQQFLYQEPFAKIRFEPFENDIKYFIQAPYIFSNCWLG